MKFIFFSKKKMIIANLRIKVLENTDYRPFIFDNDSSNKNNNNESYKSDKIDKAIAYFKINDDFNIDKFYNIPPPFSESKLLSVDGVESSDSNGKTTENKEINSNGKPNNNGIGSSDSN